MATDQEEGRFRDWVLSKLFGGSSAEVTPAAFALVGEPLKLPAVDDSAEVKRLKAALATAKADRIESDAAHFADGQIKDHKALPAEREEIVKNYRQAAVDDDMHGAVTFADGKTPPTSRVEQLTAMFAARPAHTLTKELIVTQEGGAAAFAADNKTVQPRTEGAAKMTPEQRREQLGLTALGRDILKEEANGKH